MTLASWIRHSHRWVSIVFTLTVVANFIVRVRCEPPVWVTYAPLLPLFLLLLSGLYLFALPYLQRASRSHAATDSYQERGGAMAATRPRSKDG